MDSEDSELTDFEDGEEYETGKGKGGKAKQKSTYRIRNALKAPRATTYTAQSLYDQIYNNDIDLEPEYQRDVVWPEAKQIGLIDSVFRNFYIPPVIFVVKFDDDGMETRTCIDGKQRLTSIYKFMDGIIPHKDPFTNEKLWYKDTGAKGRANKILPDKYRRHFAQKQIVCVEYQDISDKDEREIFQRVQLGMALTPAEKLQAIPSPRASFVRELQSTYLGEGGLVGSTLEWDSTRGGDFRCLSQVLYNVERYPEQKNAGTITQLDKWLHSHEDLDSDFRDKIHNTYSVFLDLAKDKQLNKCLRSPSKVAPIEFVMISILIAVYKDRLTSTQLANVIKEMRDEVRAQHKDIRLNDRVAKTMLDFIKGINPSTVKGGGGELASVRAESIAKRKRKEEHDDSGRERAKEKGGGDSGNASQKLESSRKTESVKPSVSSVPSGIPSQKSSVPPHKPATFPPSQVTQQSDSVPHPSTFKSPAPLPVASVPDRLAAIRSARLGTTPSGTPSEPALLRATQMSMSSSHSPSPYTSNVLDPRMGQGSRTFQDMLQSQPSASGQVATAISGSSNPQTGYWPPRNAGSARSIHNDRSGLQGSLPSSHDTRQNTHGYYGQRDDRGYPKSDQSSRLNGLNDNDHAQRDRGQAHIYERH